MKKDFLLILSALLLSTSYAMAKDRSIQVQGECHKKLLSDRASVQITVEIKEKGLESATEKLAKKYNQLQKKIKDLKLEDLEIKTTHYQVNPEYNWANNKREFIGYLASMGLQIETSEIDRLPLAFGIATELSISNVGNLNTFLSSDLIKKEYRKCLGVALLDAESKAKMMAKTLKLEIGAALAISEGPEQNINPPIPIHTMGFKSMQASSLESSPEISPSKETFKTQVSVIFELK